MADRATGASTALHPSRWRGARRAGDLRVGPLAGALVAVPLLLAAACGRGVEPRRAPPGAAGERTLVGRVLLPEGVGSRGVEVIATQAAGEERQRWAFFDERGHFSLALEGDLDSVRVTAGPEVHRIGAEELREADSAGRIDVGAIDLRDRLSEHRLVVRAADGSPPGEVRVAMWFGPPPVGPQGESVSLGSRQFPPVWLGSELAWLLPNEAHSIYFLVERPFAAGFTTEWVSGHQRLFGPFASADLPAELVMD